MIDSRFSLHVCIVLKGEQKANAHLERTWEHKTNTYKCIIRASSQVLRGYIRILQELRRQFRLGEAEKEL